MPFDLSDHFNSDGTVNAEGPGLATLAGDEHKESQSYKDAKDFPSFVKAAFDTHAMVGKKLENVIQKPGENATDADRAEYRKILNAERGAAKDGAEYELTAVEGLPFDKAKEAEFREFCCKGEVPKDTAKAMWDWYHDGQKVAHTAALEAETNAENTRIENLRTAWPGEKMIINPRFAYNALMAFGPKVYPDFWPDIKGEDGQVHKGLGTNLAESKVYDSPGDFEKWAKCGIGAEQLLLFAAIGEGMKSGSVLTTEGAGGGKKSENEMTESQEAEVEACNANTNWT